MPVSITGRHLEITSEIRDYIERKLPRIERSADRIQTIEFVLAKDHRYQHEVEIRLKAGPIAVTAKAADADLMRAVDILVDKVERLLQKNTAKLRGNKKHSVQTPRKDWARFVPAEEVPADESPKRVRKNSHNGSGQPPTVALDELGLSVFPSQKLQTVPMTIEEAAEMLHRSDDAFLCFINQDGLQMNVLYRRKDRNFGLIEPV